MTLRRIIAGSLLASSTACMGTYRVSPQEYVPRAKPAQIVVVDQGGSVIVVDDPAIVGDKLVGIESGTPDSVSVPVERLEDGMVRHRSKGKTWALVGGLTAGAGLAVFAVVSQGQKGSCTLAKNSTQCDTTIPDGTVP